MGRMGGEGGMGKGGGGIIQLFCYTVPSSSSSVAIFVFSSSLVAASVEQLCILLSSFFSKATIVRACS